MAVTKIGKSKASRLVAKATAPITNAAQVLSAQEPKRSAPIPATSPTLSPTLSAMTAGLRGSSSGIPCSTFPTRSAPTSAALVKIPPPTRPNNAIEEPPRPKPAMTSIRMCVSTPEGSKPTNIRYTPISPNTAKPTKPKPITAPDCKATWNALEIEVLAETVVRALPIVAIFIPTKPDTIDIPAPSRNESAVYIPSFRLAVCGSSTKNEIRTANATMK